MLHWSFSVTPDDLTMAGFVIQLNNPGAGESVIKWQRLTLYTCDPIPKCICNYARKKNCTGFGEAEYQRMTRLVKLEMI